MKTGSSICNGISATANARRPEEFVCAPADSLRPVVWLNRTLAKSSALMSNSSLELRPAMPIRSVPERHTGIAAVGNDRATAPKTANANAILK